MNIIEAIKQSSAPNKLFKRKEWNDGLFVNYAGEIQTQFGGYPDAFTAPDILADDWEVTSNDEEISLCWKQIYKAMITHIYLPDQKLDAIKKELGFKE